MRNNAADKIAASKVVWEVILFQVLTYAYKNYISIFISKQRFRQTFVTDGDNQRQNPCSIHQY